MSREAREDSALDPRSADSGKAAIHQVLSRLPAW